MLNDDRQSTRDWHVADSLCITSAFTVLLRIAGSHVDGDLHPSRPSCPSRPSRPYLKCLSSGGAAWYSSIVLQDLRVPKGHTETVNNHCKPTASVTQR